MIEVRTKTSLNYTHEWQEIKPLRFRAKSTPEAVKLARQVFENAVDARPGDAHIEIRWNWVGSHQGFYIF